MKTLRTVGSALVLSALATALVMPTAHATPTNVVANPTFGQGLADWTFTAAPSGSLFGTVTSGGGYAYFGAVGSYTGDDDSITQALNTVAGDNYTITYYLQNQGGPSNDFSAAFGGDVINSLVDANPFGYTQFTETATATSALTSLEFSGRQLPSYFDLSDISVTDAGPAPRTPAAPAPVPEPSSLAAFIFGALGLASLSLRACRRRAA